MQFKKQKKWISIQLFLFLVVGAVGSGCSSKINKDQPMSVLDQNKNGIRDYIEPEIPRIANGSEMEQLILEQHARATDGVLGHLDDPKVIQQQAEKLFKASGCGLALKHDSEKTKELVAFMNDSRESSRAYFKVLSAAIDYVNQHDDSPSIKDCEFDASKFVGKK